MGMEGIHVLVLLFVLNPILTLALLFNTASPKLMQELPLKKADELISARPSRLMMLYAIRSVPSAIIVILAFMYDLHLQVSLQLKRVRSGPAWFSDLARDCEGFDWSWWLHGAWPRCVRAINRAES